MNTLSITNYTKFVGVDDIKHPIFEGLWPISKGISYNSYLIIDEKIALIDTVEYDFKEQLINEIKRNVGERKVDYLIINHMEPDHSSSISAIRELYPEITIVANATALKMVEGFYGICGNTHEIKDGATLSLGKNSLKFYMTPMIHWPETMMTYSESEKILFSGDAFGTFGALNGEIDDSKGCFERYKEEMVRYYSNIVGKYGSPVQKALNRLKDLDIQCICSTHGPIWRKEISEVVSLYDKLSKFETEKGTVIAYSTMYGNTEKAVMDFVEELKNYGETNIRVHCLNRCHVSDVLRDIFLYDTLIVASPTYNGGVFPPTLSLMNAIEAREIKSRRFASFGSFSWAGASVKKVSEVATKLGWEIIDGSYEFKQGFAKDKCKNKELAQAVVQR